MKKKKTKNQCGRRRERIFSNACLVPSVMGVLIFFLIPFGIVVYYSLINNPIMKEYVGLDNYRNLFENSAFKQAASNTATFSLIAVPLAVVLSLGLAILLEKNIPGKKSPANLFPESSYGSYCVCCTCLAGSLP